VTKITYLIPKPSSEGGMTAITKMLYEINYFDNVRFFHFNTSYNSTGKLGRLYEFVFRFLSFIKHLIRVKPNAIFVMSNSYMGFYEKCLYCLVARIFGVKSMLNHVGGEFDKFYKQNAWNKYLIRMTIKFPNALLIGSTYWCNYFRTLFPQVTVYSVANPIIASAYHNANVSNDANAKFVITSLFRLVKEKGIYELLAVIKSLSSEFKNIEFVIIGGGPMLQDVRLALTDYIQSGNARVLGFVDDATKVKEICNSDAYLMLTHFDLMPISIMEAMAASKPVLSTRVGGIPDMVEDGVNGFLFNVGETEEVVDKLKLLIQNREVGKAMGIKGREKVDNFFDIKKITALHQHVAEELSR
jgi:glycosyltransferase involved in cell wall biosynthesis